MNPLNRALLAALVFALAAAPRLDADAGYYRFPDLHGSTLVFTAEGDLWTVSVEGGRARRLTSHAGEETQAATSPDGATVAFLASYDGPAEVYAMPLAGGAPKRLSFDGGRVAVLGWSPRGEVVYRSEAVAAAPDSTVARAVDPASGRERTLPLADVQDLAFGDDGETVFFTRWGLAWTGDHSKRYRGGAMGQLWRQRPGDAEATRLAADLEASLSRPLVWRDRLIVTSDEDGADGLWSVDSGGGDRRRLGERRELPVRGARLDGDRVVYQLGADLRLLDLVSGVDRELAIELVSDFEQRHPRWIANPLAYLTSAELAPAGDRVVLTARGRVAVASPGPERRVELPTPATSRARAAVASVDGRWIYAIDDASGSQEIWRYPSDGSAGASALTRGGAAHRWRLYPSPDGRSLAHVDKGGSLWLLDLASGEDRQIDATRVADDPYVSIVWSPDATAIAFSRFDTSQERPQLFLHLLATKTTTTLTSDRYESAYPAFSPDGHWLYFVSNRNFVANPGHPWGDRNLGPSFDRRGEIYALALQPGLRFPFAPADELAPRDDEKDDEKDDQAQAKAPEKKDGEDEDEPEKALPAIVVEGLAERLFRVPAPPGNYRDLAVDSDRLYFLADESAPDPKAALRTLAITDQGEEPKLFAAEVASFALSKDRKKLFFAKAAENGTGDLFLLDAGEKAPDDLSKAKVRVGDWKLEIDPRQEWRQMFVDAWRMHRDFAFDARLRGQDWEAVRARYEPLVDRVTDRAELDDLLGQMIAELGILHSQVRSRDRRKDPETATAAGLGARLEAVEGGLRIARVYRTERELPAERGPLAAPGVEVGEGDVIVAVNGRAVLGLGELAAALHGQAGQQVRLDVRRGGEPPRPAIVLPVASQREAELRYADWKERNRLAVDEAGGGRLGYLHLAAMGRGDIASFARDFYAQYDRDGLVIDVRRNSGGSIDSWILEKLLRRAWAFWRSPSGEPTWNMQQTFRGHVVALIDAGTYSDGETFAAGFKALGLGPLVGERTAGAGIWLSDRNSLADNGIARIAEFAQFDARGRWLIEGRGVSPDLEVVNPPVATFHGGDAQLEAAIAYLKDKIRDEPLSRPTPQPIPPVGEPADPR